VARFFAVVLFPAKRINSLRRRGKFPARAIKIPCPVWAGNLHECTGIAAPFNSKLAKTTANRENSLPNSLPQGIPTPPS